MKILFLGGSYTGRYMAAHFPQVQVAFLSRRSKALQKEGLLAFAEAEAALDAGFEPEGVVDCVPAGCRESGRLSLVYAEQLRLFQDRVPTCRMIHLSTTGVYPSGCEQGNDQPVPTFDEDTPPAPARERAVQRLVLEEAAREAFPQIVIIRPGGIYGPGRNLADQFRQGDYSRLGAGNRVISRIHVHDLNRIILATTVKPQPSPSQTVNAVDPHPVPYAEVFTWLESYLNLSLPGDWREQAPFGRAIVSRFLADLLPDGFAFPSYREGFSNQPRQVHNLPQV